MGAVVRATRMREDKELLTALVSKEVRERKDRCATVTSGRYSVSYIGPAAWSAGQEEPEGKEESTHAIAAPGWQAAGSMWEGVIGECPYYTAGATASVGRVRTVARATGIREKRELSAAPVSGEVRRNIDIHATVTPGWYSVCGMGLAAGSAGQGEPDGRREGVHVTPRWQSAKEGKGMVVTPTLGEAGARKAVIRELLNDGACKAGQSRAPGPVWKGGGGGKAQGKGIYEERRVAGVACLHTRCRLHGRAATE